MSLTTAEMKAVPMEFSSIALEELYSDATAFVAALPDPDGVNMFPSGYKADIREWLNALVNVSNDDSATPTDTTPAAPTTLVATAGDAQVSLNWDDNTEADLAGYNVHRATTTGGEW